MNESRVMKQEFMFNLRKEIYVISYCAVEAILPKHSESACACLKKLEGYIDCGYELGLLDYNDYEFYMDMCREMRNNVIEACYNDVRLD